MREFPKFRWLFRWLYGVLVVDGERNDPIVETDEKDSKSLFETREIA